MSEDAHPLPLSERPVHLGLGARAIAQPVFTGMDWYEDYAHRTEGDGAEGRLVSMYSFSEDWTSWEMHPAGDEVVVCTAGEMTVIQEAADGALNHVTIRAGDYVINPAGTWHTADVPQAATALFITAGQGTRHRQR